MTDQDKLASAFNVVLFDWIGPKLGQVVIQNRQQSDPSICHTHDWCDSNQAMIDAFENTFKRLPDLQGPDGDLMDCAWSTSKENDFNYEAQRNRFEKVMDCLRTVDEELAKPPDEQMQMICEYIQAVLAEVERK